MNPDQIVQMLTRLADGSMTFAEAAALAAQSGGAVDDIGCARIDYARSRRCGFPEFIYGAGKNASQIAAIAEAMAARCGAFFVTRIPEDAAALLCEKFPEGISDPVGRTFALGSGVPACKGKAAVLCAGTSDLPVAKECVNTLQYCGVQTDLIADVGVAGLERLFAVLPRLKDADCCIVAAGMEGALPSVVGGLTALPVIAVPTSVGYGAAMGGLAALAGMLNSCASGITVVNIDNGFGAACAALRMIRKIAGTENDIKG